MKMKTLQYDDLLENLSMLKKLLASSYECNFNISKELCTATVEVKIQELGNYVKLKKATLIGAFIEGNLIGFIWYNIHNYYGEKRLHVNQIVIDKRFRGQGIAKKLLFQIEENAKELNVEIIDLFVSEENLAAVKMYEDLRYITERRYLKKKI